MNDFTKDELKQLLQWRSSILYIAKPSDEIILSNIKLGDKIQSMIDNYCEHEYKKTLHKSGMFFIDVCQNCKDSKPRVIE